MNGRDEQVAIDEASEGPVTNVKNCQHFVRRPHPRIDPGSETLFYLREICNVVAAICENNLLAENAIVTSSIVRTVNGKQFYPNQRHQREGYVCLLGLERRGFSRFGDVRGGGA